MIKNLTEETIRYLGSKEFSSVIQRVAQYFNLNQDEEGMVFGKVNALLLGQFPEDQFLGELISELEITKAKAENIENHIKKEVIVPFKQKLATMLTGTPSVAPAPVFKEPSITTLRQSSSTPIPPVAPTPRPEENLSKAAIISEIENPPRTTIKRYVLEHDPITTPDHLIDDVVDERPRLS